MAWVEFHATRIIKLKKFSDFRTSLQMSKHEALGVLGSFWCEVIELREDGDITDWTPEYITELLGLKLSPERVWKALEAGWVDNVNERKVVHDWWDTAGTYLSNRYRSSNPEKLHKIREKLGVGVLKEFLRTTKERQPYLTIPNQTKPESISRFAPPDIQEVKDYCQERKNTVDYQKWHDFYTAKGWMVGKNKMKDWKAAVRTWEKEYPVLKTAEKKKTKQDFENEEIERKQKQWEQERNQ